MTNKIKTFIALLLLTIPIFTFSASFESGENIYISTPIEGDLYAAWSKISLESEINGDLILAWSWIYINSNISSDLIAAWWEIIVNGDINDDARIAGWIIEIHWNITDDLIVAGWIIHIFEEAQIGWDLIVNGWKIIIDWIVHWNLITNGWIIIFNWSIQQNAEINSELLTLNGEIIGSSKIISKKITIWSNANLVNDIEYWTKQGEIDFGNDNAVYNSDLGKQFKKWEYWNMNNWASLWLFALLFLSWVFVIFILLFAKKFYNNAAENINKNIWQSFWIGILYFVLTPMAAMILCITIIWIPLGLLLLTIYIFSFVFAAPLSSLIIASYLENRTHRRWSNRKWTKWKFFLNSILIYTALIIIILIPFVWVFVIIFAITSCYGALIIQKSEVIKKICK